MTRISAENKYGLKEYYILLPTECLSPWRKHAKGPSVIFIDLNARLPLIGAMTPKLANAFKTEMTAMLTAYAVKDLDVAFHHLERAHILGQLNFKTHLRTHLWMFKIGVLRGDGREITGQIIRTLAVFPASLFGWVPLGNTGGANVSALKPMAIPDDLQAYLED